MKQRLFQLGLESEIGAHMCAVGWAATGDDRLDHLLMLRATMIPVGYMAKRVAVRPDWIKAEHVVDIYSVSGCVSKDFADYINYWKHNGYWFFDSPQTILQLAQQNTLHLHPTGTKLFYYEVHDREFDDGKGQWLSFQPERSFKTQVVLPAQKALEGYDVVTFFVKTNAECSPLSCNSLATEVETNQHCLLSPFETAHQLLEEGKFKNTEPGPIGYSPCIRRSGPNMRLLGTRREASSCFARTVPARP